MIFAKNENSKRYLQEQFSERQVHRQYVALVEGIAEDGAATHHLIEDKTLRVHISERKTKESKLAITSWQVMKSNDIATLLHVLIETGRRHQIRVALADHGTPVAGDRMHGAENNLYGRICLHATALEFLHPFDDEPVRFESEYDPAWNHGLKNP
jgi:23S rRNA-/tRNA-specific pseudouridylate synthase